MSGAGRRARIAEQLDETAKDLASVGTMAKYSRDPLQRAYNQGQLKGYLLCMERWVPDETRGRVEQLVKDKIKEIEERADQARTEEEVRNLIVPSRRIVKA